MGVLKNHVFDAVACRTEHSEFAKDLASKARLVESRDVLPKFKKWKNLSMLMSTYLPYMSKPDLLAHEFSIFGDFKADLAIGDSKFHKYLLVEFENGAPDSIFKAKKGRATSYWSPRFETGFSQIVDWFWKIEQNRYTANVQAVFGSQSATFHGLLVLGKDVNLTLTEKTRLKWRLDKVAIDSNKISCVTFNELCDQLDDSLKTYYGV